MGAEEKAVDRMVGPKLSDDEDFVHLHLHTQYSLLDGTIRLKDLFGRLQEWGCRAVAQTDHGNMFGAIDFYQQARAAGIKPILGCEIYLTTGSRFDRQQIKKGATEVVDSADEMELRHQIFHLVLLAKNNIGLSNLYKIVSQAYLEGFYYRPRADYSLLEQYHEGLIASSACLKGEVAYHFHAGQDARAVKAIERLHKIFGEDFYLEIQENGMAAQQAVNVKIIDYARQHHIPLVATNDCHYLNREDATAHEVLLCVQTGKTLSDEHRMKLSTDEFYLKSPQEMRQAFQENLDACTNTLRIAEQCNISFHWKDASGKMIYHLPAFEISTGESLNEYFRRVAREGLAKRFAGPHFAKLVTQPDWEAVEKPRYEQRLEAEIDMIIQTGFPGYFLIVADFIGWAKDHNIPVGPGRGSGAGSLVAYALKITNINPLPYNLLFERFINPERISMPDFDVDFCQTRRGEVIDYVSKKYGQEHVAQIITFGSLKAKAVVKDVARVFDLSFAESNFISKLIPDDLHITIDKAIELEPKLQELMEKDPKVRQIFQIARRLEGLYRHAGMHAAGIVITNEPIVTYAPLMRGKDGESVVQFDKNFSEMIGLVKFDFLGLKTLTVLDQAVQFIRRDVDPDFDLEAIDLSDSNVFNFIAEGNTVGVFQLESSGMIDLCRRIRPSSLDDLTAINALYRPGPLDSGMVDAFIEIKHGRRAQTYPFPELEPVLKDTYGVIIYQEQVMNIARVVAGYTLGQADMLRKAMGKKDKVKMANHREIFLAGAKKNNFDLKKAENLYELMANFAEYGFNKSHAVAYALIAYQTAFLKYYYPTAFYAALLTSEISNTDKITAYIHDAKQDGIQVLPPDINESLFPFNVVGQAIRFGLGAIKNIGELHVREIINLRKAHGPYQSFTDFIERVQGLSINRKVLESFIKVGVFDQCEKRNRKTLLDNLDLFMAYGEKRKQEKAFGQGSLFDIEGMLPEGQSDLAIDEVADFDDMEKLRYESELMGVYVSGHPLDKYQKVMEQVTSMSISQVQQLTGDDQRDLTLAGLIAATKIHITKNGDKMCFATLEDLTGKIECVIFPKVYNDPQVQELMASNQPLLIQGRTNLGEEQRKFFPARFQRLKEGLDEKVSGVRVLVDLQKATPAAMNRFKEVLLRHRGTVPVHIIFEDAQRGKARMALGPDYLIGPTPALAAEINEIFRGNSVRFIINGQVKESLRT